MRWVLVAIVAIAFAVGAVGAFAVERAKVVIVIDGDTVGLEDGRRVRVLAIDTPERGKCGFGEATKRNAELALGKRVRLVRDEGEPDKDRYRRLLRYLEYRNRDIGYTLVREGYALVYRQYPTSRTPKYLRAEERARKAEKGLWGTCWA